MRLIDPFPLLTDLIEMLYTDDDSSMVLTKVGEQIWNAAIECVASKVKEQTAIDAEPVRHGRWIETNKPGWVNGQYYETPRLVCPFCTREAAHYSVEEAEHGGSVTELYWIRTDCCPNCGAKMDLKEEIE